MKKKSAKKSGWQLGNRRNLDSGNWSATLVLLRGVLNSHWRHGHVSQSALADAVGVNKRTVGRWLDGTDRPAVTMQAAVAAWVSGAIEGAVKEPQ